MKSEREKFGSRFGVLMAMSGSAIGLGNLWRFPYLTAKNGGAAFILIYLVLLTVISLPAMITEYMIGRRSRSNAYTAFERIGYPRMKFIGIIAVTGAVVLLSFYCVVGGWSLKYLADSLLLKFDSPLSDYSGIFSRFVSAPIEPLVYTFAFLGLTAAVNSGGVKKGIEKFSKIMMSLLFIVIIILAVRSVTLPGAGEGIRYLLVPDFSKVTGRTFVDALGQSFFSLGIGVGTILVYGSYVSSKEDLSATAAQTAALDSIFAIIAGIAIIPAVFAIARMNGIEPDVNAGPGLVFITLPGIFASMPMGKAVAILFFVSLLLAAITSSISIFESIVAFIIEVLHIRRRYAVLTGFLTCAVLGVFCSLSQGILSEVRVFGLQIFDFFDKLSANVLITASGLLMALFAGWIMKKEEFMDEMSAHGHSSTPKWIIGTVYALVRYAVPAGIIGIILSTILL